MFSCAGRSVLMLRRHCGARRAWTFCNELSGAALCSFSFTLHHCSAMLLHGLLIAQSAAANMDQPFDAGVYFNSRSFSDVVIRFSGREIKAHRIFLCSKSPYFQKALGPDSNFKVSLMKITFSFAVGA